MDVDDIESALLQVKRALASAEDAKRWAQAAISNDQSGSAQHAMRHADEAITSLERAKRLLQSVLP